MASTALPERRVAETRRNTSSPQTKAEDVAVRETQSNGSDSIEEPTNARTDQAADSGSVIKAQRQDAELPALSMTNLLPFLMLGLAYLALKVPASYQRPKFNWNTTKYVYAFGDSYTFVQGTAGLANFSFIGDAAQLSFTPEQLLANEIIPKNTSSDGSNWIEFLTGCLGGFPSKCSPHQLWDFAFAGADIDPNILPLHHNFSVDLVDQVGQWATYAADVIPHPPSETLTAWWIGINDTGDTFNNATITDWTDFWHGEMNSYFNTVDFAYSRGLQGTHLFINVPPGQREPARNNDPAGQAALQKRVLEFNTILSGYIEGFATRHRDLNVLTFDAYTWFDDILDNAGRYGFTNITGFCECSDPTYFWFDDGHITERVHKLLAQAIEAKLLEAST